MCVYEGGGACRGKWVENKGGEGEREKGEEKGREDGARARISFPPFYRPPLPPRRFFTTMPLPLFPHLRFTKKQPTPPLVRARGGKESLGGEINPSLPTCLGMRWTRRSRAGTSQSERESRDMEMKTIRSIHVRRARGGCLSAHAKEQT